MYKNDFFTSFLAVVIFLVIFFLLFVGIPLVWNAGFNSDIPYDTSWIHAKTAEEIIARYGEPHKVYSFTRIHQLVYELKDMPLHDDYYYIEFDENGLADDIYIAGPKGG